LVFPKFELVGWGKGCNSRQLVWKNEIVESIAVDFSQRQSCDASQFKDRKLGIISSYLSQPINAAKGNSVGRDGEVASYLADS